MATTRYRLNHQYGIEMVYLGEIPAEDFSAEFGGCRDIAHSSDLPLKAFFDQGKPAKLGT